MTLIITVLSPIFMNLMKLYISNRTIKVLGLSIYSTNSDIMTRNRMITEQDLVKAVWLL